MPSTTTSSLLCTKVSAFEVSLNELSSYFEDYLDDPKKITKLDYVRRPNYIAETCKMTEKVRGL